MTPRERFIRTLTFGDPDRVYYDFGNPRKSTLEAWYRQGLPRMPDAGDYGCPQEFRDFVGMDPSSSSPRASLGVGLGPVPPFEERTLEESEKGRLWVDSNGIVMLDAGAGLDTPGFRTRSYVSHPVRTRDDWPGMRERFDPHTPDRYPSDWPGRAATLKGREFPLMVAVRGLFWETRNWVGFENLCRMFYDDPSLVHEMMEHVTVFITEVLDRALRDAGIDMVILNEDMAYKHASMISPAMFREFMLPRYKRIVRSFKDRGVPVIMVDSDGHVGQLMPLWIEAGVDATCPIEIAAQNDPVAYRRQYGRTIGFMGCIDKREIRSLERTFIEVMKKVPWLIQQGGCLPGVDHAVPPDVPLRSYLYMCELIKAVAEGRPVPAPDAPLALEQQLGPIEQMWSADTNRGREARKGG